MKIGLPPKPSASTNQQSKEQPAPLAEAEQPNAEVDESEPIQKDVKRVPIVVKRANEFNLIYVSKPKKNKEKKERRESNPERDQVKVKLPMKVLARKLVEGEESKQPSDSPGKGLGSLKIT